MTSPVFEGIIASPPHWNVAKLYCVEPDICLAQMIMLLKLSEGTSEEVDSVWSSVVIQIS